MTLPISTLLLQAAPVVIPDSILYSVIVLLILIIVTVIAAFGGLWIRSHDNHRQWATEQINDHGQVIAVLKNDFAGIHEDLSEIKMALHEHIKDQNKRDDADRRFKIAVMQKLHLEVPIEDEG